MGIIIGSIEITGKVGNLVAYKRNGKNIIQSKGGATKSKIYNDPSMRGTKNNAFGFRNAVTVGVNLRKGIDFRNCAHVINHSKLQGFLFKEVMKKDNLNPPSDWRVLPENLKVLKTYRFNNLIPSLIEREMLHAEWLKTDEATTMRLGIPDFSNLKSAFTGFKIWGGIRVISLLEKAVYDNYDAETDLFDAGSTGEDVFDFPELNMTDDNGDDLNPDAIAVIYHWGFSTFVDGLALNNRSMNSVFMRVAG